MNGHSTMTISQQSAVSAFGTIERFEYEMHSSLHKILQVGTPESSFYTDTIHSISLANPSILTNLMIVCKGKQRFPTLSNIEYKQECARIDKRGAECVDRFFEWRDKIIPLINNFIQNHESLLLNDVCHQNFTEYVYHLPIYTLKELLTFLTTPEKVNTANYWEPQTTPDDILAFTRNYSNESEISKVVNIRYIERSEWDQIIQAYDEGGDTSMEDVKIIIPYSEYKQKITKITIKKANRKKIPDECCICLEKFIMGRKIHQTPCGHFFHASCLRTQFTKVGPPRCPLCRFDVREANVSP